MTDWLNGEKQPFKFSFSLSLNAKVFTWIIIKYTEIVLEFLIPLLSFPPQVVQVQALVPVQYLGAIESIVSYQMSQNNLIIKIVEFILCLKNEINNVSYKEVHGNCYCSLYQYMYRYMYAFIKILNFCIPYYPY